MSAGTINFIGIKIVAMRTVRAFRQDATPVSNSNRDMSADRSWN